jgi:hypothetical protein
MWKIDDEGICVTRIGMHTLVVYPIYDGLTKAYYYKWEVSVETDLEDYPTQEVLCSGKIRYSQNNKANRKKILKKAKDAAAEALTLYLNKLLQYLRLLK